MTALNAFLRVRGDQAVGAIFDHGAHVVAWQPTGASEVLFTSAHSVFDTDAAIRGGVPVVFPWFGAGRSGDLTPSHGFARLTEWTREPAGAASDAHVVAHELSGADYSPNFPHSFWARHEVSFGAHLRVTLRVRNTDTITFSFEEALHTYLRVGDVRRATVTGLDGASYRDKVEGGRIRQQVGPVRFTGETDRVYESASTVQVDDPVLGRRLTIVMSGSAQTVVWNPWADRARALVDLGDDEWPEFVCVEGANVLGSAVTLEPGEEHAMAYEVLVEPTAE